MEWEHYTVGDVIKRTYRWGKRTAYMNCGMLLTLAVAAAGVTMCSDNIGCSSSVDTKITMPRPRSALEYAMDAMAPAFTNNAEDWNQEDYSGPEE